MNDSQSKIVREALARLDIHQQWENAYRTAKNEEFFEQAFDYITFFLNAPKNSTILDVGCGICTHSIRLANRGFLVLAVDFSGDVLKMAEANVQNSGLQDKIKLQREDVLSLRFEDEMFDYTLCWGVLMHIPDIEKAISELSRVLKPGGTLIISEGNMYSLQSIILRNLKRLLGKEKADVKKTPAGLEYWNLTSVGKLLTRQSNIRWLIARFKNNGFIVKKHLPGQLTELYTRVSSQLLKNLIHSFNNLWFNYVRIPQPAFGNIIIFQKEK